LRFGQDTCKALERNGVRVTYAPVNSDGVVNLAQLAANICDETILVSVMHANNETRVVQPVEKIAALARRRGIVLHSDAVQSAGKLSQRLAADLVIVRHP
jgi:cysteine desulfurase